MVVKGGRKDLLNIELGDDASIEQINDYLYDHHLTDGLPVIPPIPDLVDRFVQFSGYKPGHVIAAVPPWWADATVAKVAANAIMAGCEDKHLPVVIAALEAITEPRFNLQNWQATTLPAYPFIVVNGPCRDFLAMNYRSGAFGPGNRANASIGRAIRLILLNIGGGRPGESDLSTLGLPGKYTACLAENEAANPWEPYHVEHGWSPLANTVTVVGANTTINVWDPESKTAQELMKTIAGSITNPGVNNFGKGGKGEIFVLLGPEHASTISVGGYSKEMIREQIWEESVIPLEHFSRAKADAIETRWGKIDEGPIRPAMSKEDIHIFVVGGVGKHSVVVFGSKETTTTREIHFPKGIE